MLRDHPRIVVVGTTGCGKTTFARALSQCFGHPHIELDSLYFGPSWTPHSEFPSRVQSAVSADRWVIEGNYSMVRDLIWQRATALVWMNYGFPVVFSRALKRTLQRVVTGREIHNGNRETWKRAFFNSNGIPAWVLRTHWSRRRTYRRILEEQHYPHLTVYEIRHPSQADRLLAESAASPQANS